MNDTTGRARGSRSARPRSRPRSRGASTAPDASAVRGDAYMAGGLPRIAHGKLSTIVPLLILLAVASARRSAGVDGRRALPAGSTGGSRQRRRGRRAGREPQLAHAVVARRAPGSAGRDRAGTDLRPRRSPSSEASSSRRSPTWSAETTHCSTPTPVSRAGDTRHASHLSTLGLHAITQLGDTPAIAVLVVALLIVEMRRIRSIHVVLFLAAVIIGNYIATTAIKDLADRARPTLNAFAATLGPSFPSGHSSTAASFYAAAALILGRRRGRQTRALLAGGAVGIAVAVAASRVLLDDHWLSDVIAGLALGWAWFSICAIAFGGRLLQFGATVEQAARGCPASAGRDRAAAGVRFRTSGQDARHEHDSTGHRARIHPDTALRGSCPHRVRGARAHLHRDRRARVPARAGRRRPAREPEGRAPHRRAPAVRALDPARRCNRPRRLRDLEVDAGDRRHDARGG